MESKLVIDAEAMAYSEVLEMVKSIGDVVEIQGRIEARGGEIREALGLYFAVDSGVLIRRSNINHRIGWVEALSFIAGVHHPEAIARAAPKSNRTLFTDEMAYGPRVAGRMGPPDLAGSKIVGYDQLDTIIEEMRIRRTTRQAVLYLARPWETCTDGLPCTTSLQFLARKDGIYCLTTMRSWDLVLGLPYDLMMFSAIQQVVASCLNEETDLVTVVAGSGHIYQKHYHYEGLPTVARFCLPDLKTLPAFREWASAELEEDWVEKPGGYPTGVTLHSL